MRRGGMEAHGRSECGVDDIMLGAQDYQLAVASPIVAAFERSSPIRSRRRWNWSWWWLRRSLTGSPSFAVFHRRLRARGGRGRWRFRSRLPAVRRRKAFILDPPVWFLGAPLGTILIGSSTVASMNGSISKL